MRKHLRLSQLLFLTLSFVSYGQTSEGKTVVASAPLTERGTCATSIFTATRMAFVIDSRLSMYSGGEFRGHKEGCKVILLRPTILVAATGVEDSQHDSRSVSHWNALDQVKSAMGTLPENPTREQLRDWAFKWGHTLFLHYAQLDFRPPYTGVVTQLLVMTKVDGQSFVYKSSVIWDGEHFKYQNDYPEVTEQASNQYSGVCRQFVNTHDVDGFRPREVPITDEELAKLNAIGEDRLKAHTIDQLSDVAMRNELEFTEIDERVEGIERASIGAPYATATWDADTSSWKTDFNSACIGGVVPIAAPKIATPSLH